MHSKYTLLWRNLWSKGQTDIMKYWSEVTQKCKYSKECLQYIFIVIKASIKEAGWRVCRVYLWFTISSIHSNRNPSHSLLACWIMLNWMYSTHLTVQINNCKVQSSFYLTTTINYVHFKMRKVYFPKFTRLYQELSIVSHQQFTCNLVTMDTS